MSLAEVVDTLLTDGQVAHALGISPKTMWNRRAAGTWPIPSIKLPQSRPRTRSQDLRMFIANEAARSSQPRGGDAYGLTMAQ